MILNGLLCFLTSNRFTCFPHNGGASVINNVLANQSMLPYIYHYLVSPFPLPDYALLSSLCANPSSAPFPPLHTNI